MAKSRSERPPEREGQVALYAGFPRGSTERGCLLGVLIPLLLWGILVVLGGCVSSPDRTGIHFKAGIGGLLSEIVDLAVEVDISTSKGVALPLVGEHECGILCQLFGCRIEDKTDSKEPIE